MIRPRLRRPRRPNMRRAVILFPSGLTLGNLFFGVFAIIAASRGDFSRAGVYVLLGGICDALDGRVARATNAGSQFGEELDSLVDAISFGLAPAMIMYFAVLNREGWDWIFVFLFAACAVMRLARFNIEQAGTAKMYFQGLPSPAAGITLASYYWFSQSWLYGYGAIGNLPWQELLRFLMALLALLMISNIPYPVFPRTGFRSFRALGASLLVLGSIVLLLTKKLEYFFPLALVYLAWGPIRWVFSGLFERRQPTIPYDLSEGEDDDDDEEEDDEDEEFEEGSSQVHASRQGHREPRPARVERGKRAPARDPSPEPARTDTPARPDRPDRPDRPQRTEAERAARREKREKREGRPERGHRPPRTDGPAEGAPAAVGGDAMILAAVASPAEIDDEVIGSIPGDVASASPAPSTEATPARKRKRRRRRGERKERGATDAGAAGSEESDAAEAADESFDEATAAMESRSPYSSAPVETTPVAAPLPTPPPIPPSVPVSLPRLPATPASSSEPHE